MIAKVILGTMTNARKLVSIAERISCDVELCSGRYVVNAKSMLDVLSMPEFEYGELHIHTDEENECNQVLERLLEEGTLVKEVAKVEKMLITGVAADKNTARISVMGVEDKPGTAFKIFNTLAKHNINVDIILQSVGRDGTKDITFTVSQDDLKEAMEVMEARKEALTIKEMNYNEKVAKVSIVGAGMLSNPGVAATMFESLSNSNININMISTSEIRITVLIDEKDADRALVAIHDGFGLED